MNNNDFTDFIEQIKLITDNDFKIKLNSIKLKNNYFLLNILNSEQFKNYTLDKIKRLYETYKNDQKKDCILENIKNLFTNNWDGAYSEITAYDALNLVLYDPCRIQLDDIEKEQTLAIYCPKSNVSTIDGFSDNLHVFFEIKTLQTRFYELMNKIKNELQYFKKDEDEDEDTDTDKDKCFIIHSNFPMGLEIEDDGVYASLKKEILNAKKNKEKNLKSNIVNGLYLNFLYERKSFLSEYHECETPFEMAKRLERLPLQDYKQFVNGLFIKVFVCTGLNINNRAISKRDFFRSLARRVFCKLTKDDKIFDKNSDLETAFIAKHLGGILFIVDNSANNNYINKKPEELYNVYFYKNPNAFKKNSLLNIGHFYTYFNKFAYTECDDFSSDNY